MASPLIPASESHVPPFGSQQARPASVEPGLYGEGGTLKSAQTRSPQQSELVAQGPLVAEQLAHFQLAQLRPMQAKSLSHPASEPLRQKESPTRKPVDWIQLPPQQS